MMAKQNSLDDVGLELDGDYQVSAMLLYSSDSNLCTACSADLTDVQCFTR